MLNKIAITVATLTFVLVVPDAVSKAYYNWKYAPLSLEEKATFRREACAKTWTYPERKYYVCADGGH